MTANESKLYNLYLKLYTNRCNIYNEDFQRENNSTADSVELFKIKMRALCQEVGGVYNEDWKFIKRENIKLIIVGLNPGKEEKQRYFSPSGDTGKQIRLFFSLTENTLGYKFSGNVEDNVFPLNLCPIFTDGQTELERRLTNNAKMEDKVKFIFSIIKSAEIICEFANEMKADIWFLNKSFCKNAEEYRIKKDINIKQLYQNVFKRISLFGHPVTLGSFFTDLYKYYEDNKNDKQSCYNSCNPFNSELCFKMLLKELGEKNKKEIFG